MKLFSTLKNDLPASIVVFLVALPLCLGVAVASGAPLFAGIITGVVGGIVVGFLSDSRLSVSGPAAGLTTIVLAAILDLGFESFLVAVILSGVIQFLLGYFRGGIIGHFFPVSVITGMLSAIGLQIILKQIPHAIGFDFNDIDLWAFKDSHGHNSISEIWIGISQYFSWSAFLIFALSLGMLLLWDRPFIKKNTALSLIPGPLLAVVIGLVLNSLYSPAMQLGSSHLVNLPIIDGFDSLMSSLSFPNFSALLNMEVYIVAITIAIVGSLESLLSLDAADKLDPEKRISSPNQELKAQGIGNIIVGFIGGIPLTAVIVRSSANINAGAKGKLSAIMHGVLLLVSALFFANYLNYIPYAALAAILIHVGLKLNKLSIYKKAIQAGSSQYVPFFVTIITILLTNLLAGIFVGIIVGLGFVLRTNFRSAVIRTRVDNNYLIQLTRSMYFFNKAQLRRILQRIPDNSNVLIDGTRIDFIDYDIVQTLNDFAETAEIRNITVSFKRSDTAVIEMFKEIKEDV
ncbi:MAG: SulP family inorganic anion transporter [Mangrovibacterium sp.]